VSSGQTFTIGTSSILEFTGTAASAAAISLTGSTQTLEIGTGGALTISAAQSVSGGATIQMAGGALSLSGTNALTIGTATAPMRWAAKKRTTNSRQFGSCQATASP